MTMRLSDDGTLDTVIVCSECGRELRYNYDPYAMRDDPEPDDDTAYHTFVDWALEDAAHVHECPRQARSGEPAERADMGHYGDPDDTDSPF